MDFDDLTIEELRHYATKATSLIMEEFGISFTEATIFVLEQEEEI